MRVALIDNTSRLITVYSSMHALLSGVYGEVAVLHDKLKCRRKLEQDKYQVHKLASASDYQALIKKIIIHGGRYAIISECV